MHIHACAGLESGGSLTPYEYESQELGVHDVEIKISRSCGICHSDVHLINNDWGGMSYPLVPGHEIVGTVTSIGTEVEKIMLGQRVGVGWQSGSCLACEWCLTGHENLCREKQLTCIGKHGGFADFIRTDSRFVFRIPKKLDSAARCSVALRRGRRLFTYEDLWCAVTSESGCGRNWRFGAYGCTVCTCHGLRGNRAFNHSR